MKYFLFLLILVSCTLVMAQTHLPFLSNLSATKDDALFTTYAAAMERSEFTLDQGYHFLFYDPLRGADFTTDTGGDLCIAFKRGTQYVYDLNRVYQPPIITMNYPDLVHYYYYPFPELRVEADFLIYSSHFAVWDFLLKNESDKLQKFQLIPFLKNDYRVYNDVQFHNEDNAITATHEELPDNWVLSHNIPFVNPVQDVFLSSLKPDRLTSYRSYQWGNISIPQEIHLTQKPVYVVWGRVSRTNGERFRLAESAPEILVTISNHPNKILTSTAPRWGSADPNISPYGYYGIELGNFGEIKNGDIYTIQFFSRQTNEMATLTDTIKNMETDVMVRKDLVLSEYQLPLPPQEMNKDIWGSGTEIRLFWKYPNDKARFNIYRRDYRQGGYYTLLEENSHHLFYTDKNIEGDQIYGYVVIAVDENNRWSMPSPEITNVAGSDFLTDIRYPNQINTSLTDLIRVMAMPTTVQLQPGETKSMRLIRGVSRLEISRHDLISQANQLLDLAMTPFITSNEKLFSQIPWPAFQDHDLEMLYWNAFNLMRQVMLPPEGKCSYNYYVFSREPTWGWGHGGQVFHESLTMLAYAFMDPLSAMNSQRVYSERQYPDGYINYRTGSYLDENIPHNNQLTTSAPWYAWQNWEIYQITHDKQFLKEMYTSSQKFYNYYVSNRDSDKDGLCEWGAHAVLESVRDAMVAVWDEVGWPSHFEGIDLNCMLVQEAKSLAKMARELGKEKEAQKWEQDAQQRSELINKYMWDEETGFYYHVDKKDNDFTFEKTNDLKREEIIGFLPLWAEIASPSQAEKLVKKLTDPKKFWRIYGVPSLAADDSYYNPKGYWNGPVWVEWDYLIVHGLLLYGYEDLARELVQRVAENMIAQLKKDHQFWEFYSPDEQWAGYHKQYIWAGIINRMMLDVYK